MVLKRVKSALLVCVFSGVASSALAGGWSTEGIADYGLMFEEGRFIFEGQTTYAARNVDFKNARTTAPGVPITLTSNGTARDVAPNVFFNSGAVKVNLYEGVDFFARLNQPYVIREQPGYDWNGRLAIAETNADALGFDAMLSYKHEVADGNFLRVFGGLRSVTVDYEQIAVGSSGRSRLAVNTEREYGYRIGAAYEIPEIALRAMVAYESAIGLNLRGTVNGAQSVSAQADLPQSIEAKVQTGIAPKWLATLGVKWTDWSVLDKLAINAHPAAGITVNNAIVRDLGYSDGWIVEAGVGHKLTEKLSLGSSLTWDKGIGGPYSDYYALSLGGSYDITDKVKFTLGGRAIYKTAGNGVYQITKAGTGTVQTNYAYDSSWNFALSSKLRIGF